MSKARDSGCYLFNLFQNKTRRLDENTEAERAAKIKEVQKEIQVQNVATSYELVTLRQKTDATNSNFKR